MSNGASELQFENADVRVTRWTLAHGEETGPHRHEHNYIVVPVADAVMVVTESSGTVTTREVVTGSSYYRQAGVEHNVRSEKDAPLDFVEVELMHPPLTESTTGIKQEGSRPPRVRPVHAADREAWGRLYKAYADFYGVDQCREAADMVWSWLHDPAHELQGLVVESVPGRILGLAHYRTFARPLTATIGCWLDDLFVEPEARGGGLTEALLFELRQLAGANRWSVVRWITADNNYRARAAYDKVAMGTDWVTYDMAPLSGPSQMTVQE